MSGVFIALEGLDGSGKSTVAKRLLGAVRDIGRTAILTREPGGTNIGEAVRNVLFGPDSDAIYPETEALLFAAARAQLVREVLRPALDLGGVVVTDRFADSSLAYQWGGRQLPLDAVKRAQELATGGLEPDLKFLLDLLPDVAMRRRCAEENQSNRLDKETLQFHTRVRNAYLALAAMDPERWRVIDADRSPDQVWVDVWREVSESGLLEITSAATGD